MAGLKRLGWLGILIAGLALFEIIRRALISTGNPSYVPSLILLGSAVVPTSFVAFLYQRRLGYDVSSGYLFAVALAGGVIGVVTAGVLEFRTLRDLGVLPMVAVGLIEEGAKLIGPLAVLSFTRHRLPADGLLLGVATGAGFAVLETMGYAFVALVQSRGNLAVVDGVLLIRGVLSPAAHMAWTGLAAAALWQIAGARNRGRAVLGFAAMYLVAVALHTTWDLSTAVGMYVIVAAISLALLFVVVHRLHHAQAAGGPDQPVITLPGQTSRARLLPG